MIEIQNVNYSKVTLLVVFMAVTCAALLAFPGLARAAEPTVDITLESQPLRMEVPPVIVQDRTLVGVRFVSEAVGGTVEWDPVGRRVIVQRYADTIILTVGSLEAQVNGTSTTLEVAPQIVADRTMVPLRFIAEALGGTVQWNGETRTVNILRKPTVVTAMTYTPGTGSSAVKLKLSEPLLSVTPRTEGNSVYLELYPALVAEPSPERNLLDALLRQLRLQAEGRTARLEAHLWNTPLYRHSLSQDGTELTLEFDHKVLGFQTRQSGRIAQLSINTTGKVAFTTLELANPPRLVIDIAEAPMEAGVPESTPLSDPLITQVRWGKQPTGTRVVLDLKSGQPYEVLQTDLGLVVQFVPRLTAVKVEKLQGKSRLTFAGNLPVDAKVTAQAEQKLILLEIPDSRSDLPENLIKVADGTIDTISVARGAAIHSTVITIALPYYLGHIVVSKPGDPNTIIELVTSPVYGKRIWVDAGHGKIPGGKDDPGTVGPTYKTYEKNVNLQVALDLQKRLQAAGATVLMTRTGDSGIDFTQRPALVNAAKPPVDLFLSIHHNSAASLTVRGTETYYWTTNPRSKPAAERIHAALLAGLKFPDRRVRSEAFVVIRDVRAPAVLVELGYLSNPEEERAIAEPGVAQKTYPGRAAEALRNGIFAYFWQEIRTGVAN